MEGLGVSSVLEGLEGYGRIWESPVGSLRVLQGLEGLGGSSKVLDGLEDMEGSRRVRRKWEDPGESSRFLEGLVGS